MIFRISTSLILLLALSHTQAFAQQTSDHLRMMQNSAMEKEVADWAHWGGIKEKYSDWTTHSNRLIPIYTYGVDLKKYKDKKSVYRRKKAIEQLYGQLPEKRLIAKPTILIRQTFMIFKKTP